MGKAVQTKAHGECLNNSAFPFSFRLYRWFKYTIHRILFIKKDSQAKKDFLRAVEETKADLDKNIWRIGK